MTTDQREWKANTHKTATANVGHGSHGCFASLAGTFHKLAGRGGHAHAGNCMVRNGFNIMHPTYSNNSCILYISTLSLFLYRSLWPVLKYKTYLTRLKHVALSSQECALTYVHIYLYLLLWLLRDLYSGYVGTLFSHSAAVWSSKPWVCALQQQQTFLHGHEDGIQLIVKAKWCVWHDIPKQSIWTKWSCRRCWQAMLSGQLPRPRSYRSTTATHGLKLHKWYAQTKEVGNLWE